MDGETPSWGPLYPMSRTELLVLKEWLEENMSKGFIRHSSSPFAAPGLFPKKLDGGLRFCIEYRDIICPTIENRHPLTLITETPSSLEKVRIYPKLVVQGAYNSLRVEDEDGHELSFRTRYGLFEPTVMKFWKTNAPAEFQGYINNAIREALDEFASAYWDDVLIYSDSEEEHEGHV